MYFWDLVLYLLRLNAAKAEILDGVSPRFFADEIFTALVSHKFKFIFFVGVRRKEEIPKFHIWEAVERLSSRTELHNFELIVKETQDPMWDRTTFKHKIPADVKKIYLSADEDKERVLESSLLSAGFSPSLITKL